MFHIDYKLFAFFLRTVHFLFQVMLMIQKLHTGLENRLILL